MKRLQGASASQSRRTRAGLLNEIASSNDAMANRSPIGIGSAVHKVVRLLANVGDTDWLESQV